MPSSARFSLLLVAVGLLLVCSCRAEEMPKTLHVTKEEASLLLQLCPVLSPRAQTRTVPPDALVGGGDIVFNLTIDAPSVMMPNLKLVAHDFDVDLKITRMHIPVVNYMVYSSFALVQLFTFVILFIGYLCLVRPLQRRLRRMEAVLYKHDLIDDIDALEDDTGIDDRRDGRGRRQRAYRTKRTVSRNYSDDENAPLVANDAQTRHDSVEEQSVVEIYHHQR